MTPHDKADIYSLQIQAGYVAEADFDRTIRRRFQSPFRESDTEVEP